MYCGFNVSGVCPVKNGTMPDRIMNAAGRPIPFHLYLNCKADFNAVHGGATKTQDDAAALLLMDNDPDIFGLSQRVQGMTMCAWGIGGPALGCEDDFVSVADVDDGITM